VPKDGPIDGVDQSAFFRGSSEKSAREGNSDPVRRSAAGGEVEELQGALLSAGDDGFAADQARDTASVQSLHQPTRGKVITDGWIFGPVLKMVGEFEASTKTCRLIAMGTPDPYTPPH
jgi:hypothetical protein